MARSPGATLQTADGSYRIHEVVAVGGFASVYYGRNLKTNVPVAVKMLHPHHVSNERVVRLFIHEAVLARGLRHPSVVGIVDQGQAEDGQPFIVMEWMTGWTVATLIEERGAFAAGEAAFVAEQTLRALAAAHGRQIYHRDIKPANVMLTADGVVKVMDFGISKDASLAAATGASTVMGTPAYMAPEQFRGEAADGRTDLYAVGVTLYQMLAGKVPFESTTTHGYMYQHLQAVPPRLRDARPELPAQLESIVMIALEKPKERRFQSAEAMAAALASFSSRSLALPSHLPDGTMVAEMSTPAAVAPRVPTPTPPGPAVPTSSGPAVPPPVGTDGPGWGTGPGPTRVPPARPSFVWPLIAVAAALLVFGGLVSAYLLFEGRRSSGQATVTPSSLASAGSTAGSADSKVPTIQPPAAGSSPTVPGATAANCGGGLTTASSQRQQRTLADAAATLEGLRASGCDVVEPLYEVYVEHGREFADQERIDEAITRFDLALQVKNGDEARSARALAAAYREGRGAIERRSWDDAIQKLDQVQRSSPTYARGNVATHLGAALIGKGDELRRQGKLDEALEVFQRAAQLKPGDTEAAAHLRDAEAERENRRVAQAAAREPTQTPISPPTPTPPPTADPPPPASVPADLERVASDYYGALNARRYDQAYGLLSARARQQQTLERFRARFTNTRGISVRSIENTRIQGSAGTLTVRTQTLNATPQGDQVACSRVEWALVLESGGWRRDVVSGSGNEQDERC
jgi:serine/threonine protein kinase/tetratricopeptide (TPR) repeat protein